VAGAAADAAAAADNKPLLPVRSARGMKIKMRMMRAMMTGGAESARPAAAAATAAAAGVMEASSKQQYGRPADRLNVSYV